MSYGTSHRLFRDVRTAAAIEPRPRLGWDGMRRVSVDAAIEASATMGAPTKVGGRGSEAIPLSAYHDRDSVADRRAARCAR